MNGLGGFHEERFVSRVEGKLDALLSRGHGKLDEAARHICLAPKAKRARPRLCYLFGQALGVDSPLLEDVAVTVELIHTASLLHDDVIDEGDVRRGFPTVNAKWDNLVAVLTGDLMLSGALLQLEKHPVPVIMGAARVVYQMTRAAMFEADSRGNLDLTLEEWESIATGKTGVLFGWCGEAAGHLAERPDMAKKFSRCGHLLGVAFQMADDLLDLKGGASKDPFADISNRNPSYPLLRAIQISPSLGADLKAAWAKDELTPEEVRKLGHAVLETGVAGLTMQVLSEKIAEAIDCLGDYREAPGGSDIVGWARALWGSLSSDPMPA